MSTFDFSLLQNDLVELEKKLEGTDRNLLETKSVSINYLLTT